MDTVKEISDRNSPEGFKCFRLKVTKHDVEIGWIVCISFGPHPGNLVAIMVVNDQNWTSVDDV